MLRPSYSLTVRIAARAIRYLSFRRPDLQFDVVSRTYAGENKLVKVPKKLLGWWEQIVEVAAKHDKQPMLRIVPSNEGKHPELHIITKERHEELLDMEFRLEGLDK